MKYKIGIISESITQYNRFIEETFKVNPNSYEAKKLYHYINVNFGESGSGLVLSEFIFASDKLRDIYHLFKKIESRVR